jgi:NitT/TauT family transport system substrate-binding protein
MMKPARIILVVFCFFLFSPPMGFAQIPKPEKTKIVLAVGGQQSLVYLPVSVAWRLGYFKEAGLDVDLQNLAGGGQALKALVGGSADFVSGFYDHTIQMNAQGKKIKAVVMQQRYPGLVLMLSKGAKDQGLKNLVDLKGKKIGVTAIGSSTHFFVNYLLNGVGLSPEDYSVIGVGIGSTAVAALHNKQIEALSGLEPSVSTLQNHGDVGLILADTRSTAGTNKIFGGSYPAGCIYTREETIRQYPQTTQAVVNTLIKALRWMQTHKPEEIVALMPEEYYQGNKEIYLQALKNMLDSYSPDGRIVLGGAQNVAKVMSSDPVVKKAAVNLTDTFDMHFVEAFWKALKK